MSEDQIQRTREDVVGAYRRSTVLLVRELEYIFGEARNEHDVGVHNKIAREIAFLCPDRKKLLQEVAFTIIRCSKETPPIDERNKDGKGQKR